MKIYDAKKKPALYGHVGYGRFDTARAFVKENQRKNQIGMFIALSYSKKDIILENDIF